MEKNLLNCKKIELILILNIKKSLLTTFKTIQAFNDSKKITGLNFEEFSEKGTNNSIIISALSLNVNSEKSFSINSEKSEKEKKEEKLGSKVTSQKLENQENSGKSEKNKQIEKPKLKNKLINDFYNQIQDKENLSIDLSINTNQVTESFKEENKTEKESLNTTTVEENDINKINIYIRRKSTLKKSLSLRENKGGSKGRVRGGSKGKKRKVSIFKNKISEYDEISEDSSIEF